MYRGIFRGDLDDEQRAVFALILGGKTGREIAANLGVAPSRIEGIVRKTCRQLDTSSRHDAARIVARHLDWKTSPPPAVVRANDDRQSDHFGTGSHDLATKMVLTKREHSARSEYVRDAGNQAPTQGKHAGAYNEIAERFSISKLLAASPLMRCVLLIAVLIASFSLALSALVSAMQGFDVLMFS